MLSIELVWTDYFLALSVFVLIIFIGIRGTRRISSEQFLVGNRDIKWFLLGPTIAAGVMGGGVLMIFSEYAYEYGLSAMCIIAGISLGTFLLIPFALRFKQLADENSFYSLPDLFRQLWGSQVGLWVSVIVLIWTMGFMTLQLIAAGYLLEPTFGLPYWQGVLVTGLVVLIYLAIGGFRSVIVTDFLQYFALAFILILVLPSINSSLDWKEIITQKTHFDAGTAIGFFFLGALNILVSSDLWQRIYAARSKADARKGVVFGGILVFAVGILLMFPALASGFLELQEGADEKTAIVAVFAKYTPRWMLGFAMAAILMSIMSTLDTMVFVLGLSISHDLMVRVFGKPVKYRLRAIRISMTVALLIGSSLAILYKGLLEVAIGVTTFGLILTPALLIRKRNWQLSKRSVLWSFYFGLAAVIVLVIGEIFIVDKDILTPENSILVFLASLVGAFIAGVYNKCSKK